MWNEVEEGKESETTEDILEKVRESKLNSLKNFALKTKPTNFSEENILKTDTCYTSLPSDFTFSAFETSISFKISNSLILNREVIPETHYLFLACNMYLYDYSSCTEFQINGPNSSHK